MKNEIKTEAVLRLDFAQAAFLLLYRKHRSPYKSAGKSRQSTELIISKCGGWWYNGERLPERRAGARKKNRRRKCKKWER